MLSLHPQAPQNAHCLPYHRHLYSGPTTGVTFPHADNMSVGQHQPSNSNNMSTAAADATVKQALEIARESPDGASDPTISSILDAALNKTWNKVLAQPDSYVMSPDEFAVFNFFQHRFVGNKMAVAARKRYWDNTKA